MADLEDIAAGPRGPNRSTTLDHSSAADIRDRGVSRIARAQLVRHRRLSKLSVKERRRALAQWLRGMKP
jgi:hypothetical protein